MVGTRYPPVVRASLGEVAAVDNALSSACWWAPPSWPRQLDYPSEESPLCRAGFDAAPCYQPRGPVSVGAPHRHPSNPCVLQRDVKIRQLPGQVPAPHHATLASAGL